MEQTSERGVACEFVHIAVTASGQKSLSEVDRRFHRYPYKILFNGSYHDAAWPRRAWRVLRTAMSSRADVIVLPGYHEPEYWALLLYAVLTRTPRLLTLDSTRYDKPKRWYTEFPKRLFVALCDGALCYGTRSSAYLGELGMAPDRISIRCQAAPNEFIREAASDAQAWRYPDEAVSRYLLYVGRLAPEKDLFRLLDAFARVRRAEPGLGLVLVGEGPLRAALEAKVLELDLAQSVRIEGGKPLGEVARYYAGAWSLVLPSWSEPWGLVVNEAFVLGCPAIVSDRCGCAPDLVIEDQTGYTFEAGSVAALVEALEKMLSRSANEREAMGEACRQHIEVFSPANAAAQMLTAFERHLK